MANDFSPANVAGLRRNAVLAASFVFGLAIAVSLATPVQHEAGGLPGGGGIDRAGAEGGGPAVGDSPAGGGPGAGVAAIDPDDASGPAGAPPEDQPSNPENPNGGGGDGGTSTTTTGTPSADPLCIVECLGDPNSLPGLPPDTLEDDVNGILSSTSSSPIPIEPAAPDSTTTAPALPISTPTTTLPPTTSLPTITTTSLAPITTPTLPVTVGI